MMKPSSWGKNVLRSASSALGVILLLVIFSVISVLKYGEQYFFTAYNMKNILMQASAVGVVAIGQTVLLIGGNFDLSLGRIVCLTSCIGAVLMKNGVSAPVSILVMFAAGLVLGTVNGVMVTYVGVPAMIATLGTQYVCFGVAKLITKAAPIAPLSDEIAWFGRGYIADVIPVCVVILLVLYLAAQFVLKKTKAGRMVYAVGGSGEAAYYAGIPVKKVKMLSFIFAALMAVLGALLLMSRINSVALTNGQNYEFDAVIAAIIGGVSLSGGKGHMLGTLLGVLFLTVLFIGFSQMGVDPFVQDVLKGFVLVLAVVLDVLSSRKKA